MVIERSKALRRATVLALVYAVVAGTYIWLSGHMALSAAPDITDLSRIEAIKGTAFVVLSALALLGGSFWLLSRAERDAAEIRRSREALLLAEQRALAGLLASSVAHDFGNLLVPLHAGVRELREELDGALTPNAREVLGEMTEAVDRLVEVSRRQMTMGREGAGRFRDVDLASVVREAVQIAARHTHVRGTSLRVDGPDALPAFANPTLVQQVVMNLVVNAAEATSGGGRVEVNFGVQGDDVFIEVNDDGPGLPEGDEVFEPFYTTKANGTGLGLFSVRACAALHGGAVEVGTSSLGGASVRVRFPRAREERAAA